MKTLSKFIVIATLMIACADVVNAQKGGSYGGHQQRYSGYRRSRGSNLFGVYWRDATWDQYIYLLPAHVGATAFLAVGNLVGWPCTAIYTTCRWDVTMESFLPPGQFSNKSFAPVGGYLLGGPFWMLKKGLIDGPIWLYDSTFGEPEPDKHQELPASVN